MVGEISIMIFNIVAILLWVLAIVLTALAYAGYVMGWVQGHGLKHFLRHCWPWLAFIVLAYFGGFFFWFLL